MPRNVEVKVAVSDLAALRAAAVAAGARPSAVEEQTDRYYELDGGRRVKLRTRGAGAAELIRYDRPETAGVRPSDYEITPVRDRDAGTCLVPPGEPVAVVRKHREVLLLENVRIHLDRVDRLGTFLELEAAVDAAHDDVVCHRQVAMLLEALGLTGAEPIRASYGELVRHAP